jgi:signal transduction histidine kinase
MADDRDARIAQLEAELQQSREREGVAVERALRAEAALAGALERQTATGEILGLIAASPTDVQPVLDAVAERAARLCDTYHAAVSLVDGDVLRTVARYVIPITAESQVIVPPTVGLSASAELPIAGSIGGRAVADRRTIHVHDATGLSEEEYPYAAKKRYSSGHRTLLATPLIREGVAIGVIVLRRMEVRPFTDQQITLLETFADQTVIAIENARLFQELEQRNQQLTETLYQQAASAEVLRAVASSPTALQQVLDTIVATAARLCGASGGGIWIADGDEATPPARYGTFASPENLLALPRDARIKLSRESTSGRAMLDECIVHRPDIMNDPEFPLGRALSRAASQRTTLAVPLVGEHGVVGAFSLGRTEVRPFSEREIELIKTFADQAVIAIENARLFQKLHEANRQLEAASQHKSQFLANMSHELRTPLNAIIGYSEMLQEEAEDLDADAFLPDLQKVNAAGTHLLGLINDILDLSKIEAGRMDLFVESFEVQQLVQDVAAIVRPLIEKNANTLVVICPEDVGTMHADLTKLRQALFNLLSNAAKFTDHGTIELRVAREAPPPTPSTLPWDPSIPTAPSEGEGRMQGWLPRSRVTRGSRATGMPAGQGSRGRAAPRAAEGPRRS